MEQIAIRPERPTRKTTRGVRSRGSSSLTERSHSKFYYFWYFANTIWAVLAFPLGLSAISFVRNHRKQNVTTTPSPAAIAPVASAQTRTRLLAADPETLAVRKSKNVEMGQSGKSCNRERLPLNKTWRPPFTDFVEDYSYVEPVKGPVFCVFNHSSYKRHQDWAFRTGYINGHLCTHVIYASAMISEDELVSADPAFDIVKEGFRNLALLKSRYAHLKVLVSFGEYEKDTAILSLLTSSPTRRTAFALNVRSWLNEYDYDGVNVHWMHPAGRCGSSEDSPNLVKMVEKLRSVIDKNYTISLTFTSSATLRKRGYDLRDFVHAVDHFIVQTHDLYDSTSATVHCACPYSNGEWSLSRVLAEVTTELKEVAAAKLCFGVSLGGISFRIRGISSVQGSKQKFDKEYGVGMEGEYTRTRGRLAFYEACSMKNVESFLDFRELCSFMVREHHWIGYETPLSLASKLSEVFRKFGVSCVAVWDIDMDDFKGACKLGQTPLLSAVNREVAIAA
ncbi:hypothetical protein HPB47_011977 [Ixodes persulcatus]|uniref:Uncharacterized protein n=1 Tax=Ixodes persulcatus TaxID=34615 RepID=A0AC60NV07_IXOPE|nr:hypothetical protein HPB47_011977 [Ixodes persulcatus]